MKQSPFLRFWAALNAECRAKGSPEPTFGPARRAWEIAVDQATRESFAIAMRAAGAR